MRRFLATPLVACALVLPAAGCSAQRPAAAATPPTPAVVGRPITFADFATMPFVSDPQLSPDGSRVLYAVRTTDIDANRRTTRTFVLSLDGKGVPTQFPDAQTNATEARWSPDGARVAFASGGQLWVADASGANKRQLTTLNGGATGPVWAPTSDRIAFTSGVYPDCKDDACNVGQDSVRNASKVKAFIADNLLYRHWTQYDPGTRSHLYVVPSSGGAVRDLMPGAVFETPVAPFGGSEQYAWSPDGRELAFSAKDQARASAWTTDVNLYVVPADGSGAPVVITSGNAGADQNPVYTPDGRYIAYQSQERAGYESDRWRLMLFDRSARSARELLPSFDRNADAWFFTPDMRAVYVAAQDRGRDKLYRFTLGSGLAAGPAQVVVGDWNNTAFSFSRDLRTVAWSRDAGHRPPEVYVSRLTGTSWAAPRQLTHETDKAVAALSLPPLEEYWYRGAGGDSVQGFVLRPPGFRAGQRYPTVVLIHGGPQGAFIDNWHGRWNYQMFAAPGNVVMFVNPRGSTGYGQRFVSEVSRDWGGKAYEDIMKGVDAAIARYSFIDSSRLAAAGGSYGGYMANWINGHTNRFKALVSHAGVFNLEAMYGATEEIWFTEWEFGGAFWDSTAMREQYRRWSPHLAAGSMRTPTLVIHGELDYRVPYTEGLSLFTALQRQNVPSRLIVFPDEGHWIGKPQNQRLWWREVQGWISKYTAKPVT